MTCPFEPYVQAARQADPHAMPYCPTRPWWRKYGQRWWRQGSGFTVSFPGDGRIFVWQPTPPGEGRKANALALAIGVEDAASALDPRNPPLLAVVRALALVDATGIAAPPEPPVLLGQVWRVGGGAGAHDVLIAGRADRVARPPGLLLSGPFAPWAPPTYTVAPEVELTACGISSPSGD